MTASQLHQALLEQNAENIGHQLLQCSSMAHSKTRKRRMADGLVTDEPTKCVIRLGQPFDLTSAARSTQSGIQSQAQQHPDTEAISATLAFDGLRILDKAGRFQSLDQPPQSPGRMVVGQLIFRDDEDELSLTTFWFTRSNGLLCGHA